MISLRTMMVLVLVFGGWLGWFVRRVQVQRDAVAAVEKSGRIGRLRPRVAKWRLQSLSTLVDSRVAGRR